MYYLSMEVESTFSISVVIAIIFPVNIALANRKVFTEWPALSTYQTFVGESQKISPFHTFDSNGS